MLIEKVYNSLYLYSYILFKLHECCVVKIIFLKSKPLFLQDLPWEEQLEIIKNLYAQRMKTVYHVSYCEKGNDVLTMCAVVLAA